jgi:predicted nucleotidyltransferase
MLAPTSQVGIIMAEHVVGADWRLHTVSERAAATLGELRRRRAEILETAARHGASNIRVFGSVARGDADAASDVDLLVEITTDARGLAYFGVLEDLRRALEDVVERPVDIVELRGPFSPRGQMMADRIREEAVPL